MRIIFMGTPDFAVPCLEALLKSRHEVVAVFSQPDKPVGRKQILTPPPVKQCAVEAGLPVHQPTTLKTDDALSLVKGYQSDLIIVVAYGKILPPQILTAAPYGCINVHASLLPKYRGAAPIQWAVLNGDQETGVTIMQMDEGLDTGDMLSITKTSIDPDETSEMLFDRLSQLGADALLHTLDKVENGTVTRTKQPQGDFGYAEKITKALSPIDWSKSALEIHNQIRGLQTWPCAATVILGKNVKVHASRISKKTGSSAGEVVCADKVITVCCGDGRCLDITALQLEGKKRLDAKSFLSGFRIPTGTILGE